MDSDMYHEDGQEEDGENEPLPNPSSSQDHVPPDAKPVVLLLTEENVKKLEKEYEEGTGSVPECSVQEYIQQIFFSQLEKFRSSDTNLANASEKRGPGVLPPTTQQDEKDRRDPWKTDRGAVAETSGKEFVAELPTHFQDDSILQKTSMNMDSTFVLSENAKAYTSDDREKFYVDDQTQTDWDWVEDFLFSESVKEWREKRQLAKAKQAKAQGRKEDRIRPSGVRDQQICVLCHRIKPPFEKGKQLPSDLLGKAFCNCKSEDAIQHELPESDKQPSISSHSEEEEEAADESRVSEGDGSTSRNGTLKGVRKQVQSPTQKTKATTLEETAKDTTRQDESPKPTSKQPKRATDDQKKREKMKGDGSKQPHPSFTNLKKYKRSIKTLQERNMLMEVNEQSVLSLSEPFSSSGMGQEVSQQQRSRFLTQKRSLKRLQTAYEPQEVKEHAAREPFEFISGDETVKGTGDETVKGTGDETVKGTGDETMKGTSDETVKGSSDETVKGSSDETVKDTSKEEKKKKRSIKKHSRRKLRKGSAAAFKAAIGKALVGLAALDENKISFKLSKAKETWPSFFVEVEESDELFMVVAVEETKFLKSPHEVICKYYPSGDILLILFSDETGQIYYPSGRLAIMIIHVGPDDIIYIIFEDDEMKQIRAVLRSDGHATCYQQKQLLWLNLRPIGGYYFDEDGRTRRRWSWWDFSHHVHAPPFQSINMKLNDYIRIHVKSQDRIYLIFSEEINVVGFNTGAKLMMKDQTKLEGPKAQIPIIEHYLHLQTASIHRLLHKIQSVLKPARRSVFETLEPQDLIAQFQGAQVKQMRHFKKKDDTPLNRRSLEII